MNDTFGSPAPLVEHALQSLRDTTPDAAAQIQATSTVVAAPATGTLAAAPSTGTVVAAPSPPAQPLPLSEVLAVAQPAGPVKDSATSTLLDSAMDALRTVSVSAQTRLADPDAFPELPLGRDLPDLGPFVELVMREAQAAAAAYREEAARETTALAAELLATAATSAAAIRREADAYSEQTRAAADASLAQRVRLIADLTERLAQMAQLAGDDFSADQRIRDQMMTFISALTAAAHETVTAVFPSTTSSSRRPPADNGDPGREERR